VSRYLLANVVQCAQGYPFVFFERGWGEYRCGGAASSEGLAMEGIVFALDDDDWGNTVGGRGGLVG
jgi:hypothetical protein